MAKRSDISSSMFEVDYVATVRIIMYHDNVHRKNKTFVEQSIQKSGFSKVMTDLIDSLGSEKSSLIVKGDCEIKNTQDFVNYFSDTVCKYYVNYHDEKMCTVEFACKFDTDIKTLLELPEHVLDEMHLEIFTPVGSVQL